MFTNVIIAIDRGPSALDAVALARRLVAPDGRLTLAHVWRRPENRPRSSAARIDRADRLLHSARLSSRIETVAGVGARDVAGGLHGLARRRGADLIVVGSSAHGALRRALTGQVVAKTITAAPCPVAVAPAGYHLNAAPVRAVGAGYGDWEAARPLVVMARRLAGAHGGRLSLYKSLAPVPAISYLDAGAVHERIAHTDWDDALDLLLLSDNAPLQVGLGDVAQELARFSADLDLLVVASRCPSRLGRLIRPNASAELTRTSRCPLLVVGTQPGPAEDDRGGDWSVAAA